MGLLPHVEDEYHVFIICSLYEDIRYKHDILVVDFYSLLQIILQKLDLYFRDINN